MTGGEAAMKIRHIYRKSEKVIVIRQGGLRRGWVFGILAALLLAAAGVLLWGTSGGLTGEDKYIRLCAETALPSALDGVSLAPEQAEQVKALADVLSWQQGPGGASRPEGIVLCYEEQDVTLTVGTDGKNTVIWGETGKRPGRGRAYAAPNTLWQKLSAWKEENLP